MVLENYDDKNGNLDNFFSVESINNDNSNVDNIFNAIVSCINEDTTAYDIVNNDSDYITDNNHTFKGNGVVIVFTQRIKFF